jgi:hypothetical protein
MFSHIVFKLLEACLVLNYDLIVFSFFLLAPYKMHITVKSLALLIGLRCRKHFNLSLNLRKKSTILWRAVFLSDLFRRRDRFFFIDSDLLLDLPAFVVVFKLIFAHAHQNFD